MSFATSEWPKADDVTRSLPHAVGAEKSVLSTLLQEPQEFIPVAIEEGLTERHFYLPAHATLFEFICQQFSNGREIELVSMVQTLLDRGQLERVGGPAALTDIYNYSVTSVNFRLHVTQLRKKFRAREILRLSNQAIAEVYESPDEVDETLETLERDIMAVRDTESDTKPQTTRQAVHVVLGKFQSQLNHEPIAKGILTGFDELDRMTQGGLKGGEMFVIGARPSVGKTSFVANIVEHCCVTNGLPCLFFSAEMSTEAIIRRMVFSRARFATSQLSYGYTPTKGDLLRIKRASIEVADAPLHIDDTSQPGIGYIRAKARRMHREHGIGLIAIDYLQLIKGGSKQAMNSREREIAEISAGVKALAKDLGIPVVILAQLSREVEKRAKGGSSAAPLPRMSDLRESGAIEQDADLIGLLSREAYQSDANIADGASFLNLAKNRNGETGVIPLTFVADLMRFESGKPYVETAENGWHD